MKGTEKRDGERQTREGCKQIWECVFGRLWARQFQNICSPEFPPFSTPVWLCPSCKVVVRGSELLHLLQERSFTPFRPWLAFSTQTSNFSKTRVQSNYKEVFGPYRRKVSRRKLTTTSSRSLKSRRQSCKVTAQEQAHLYDLGQIHWLLSISRLQVKDYYITVLWLIS